MLKFYKRVTLAGDTQLLHRLVAAHKLGRELTNTEVVHHIDEDKLNNSPENLMVMRSKADHAALHQGVPVEYCAEADHYVRVLQPARYICKTCSKPLPKLLKTRLCGDCYRIKRQETCPDKGELLRSLFRQKGNFSALSRELGVSDNTIRKWCRRLHLSTVSKDYK